MRYLWFVYISGWMPYFVFLGYKLIFTKNIEGDYLYPRVGKLLFTIDEGNNSLTVEELVCYLYNENNYKAFWAEGSFWYQLYNIVYSDLFNLLSDELIIKLMHKHNISNLGAINIFFKENIDLIKSINNELRKGNIDDILSDDCKIITKNNIQLNKTDIIDFFSYFNKEIVIKIIYEKILNYSDTRFLNGIPDLIVYNNKESYFIEVKSEKDRVFEKQKKWHKYLDNLGANVIICNVKNRKSYLNKKFPELIFKKFNFDLYEKVNHKLNYKKELYDHIAGGHTDDWIGFFIENQFYDEFILLIDKIEKLFNDNYINQIYKKENIQYEKNRFFKKIIKNSKLSKKNIILEKHINTNSFQNMIDFIIKIDKALKASFLERIGDVYFTWNLISKSNKLFKKHLNYIRKIKIKRRLIY